MATTTAIAASTSASTSANIAVADGASIKVWVSEALEAGEDVTIIQTDNASVEVPLVLYDLSERRPWAAQITPGVTAIRLAGPGTYKVAKSVTNDSIAVYYDS